MTRPRRQDDAQYGLPFGCGYNASMARLRADLDQIDPAELGVKAYAWGLIREVLLAVWSHAGAEPDCWREIPLEDLVTHAELDHQKLSESQAKRYRGDARTLGLLESRRSNRGTNAVAWRLNRDRIAELARRCASVRVAEIQCAPVRPGAPRCAPIEETPIPKPQSSEPKPPPPNPRSPRTAAHRRAPSDVGLTPGWGEGVADLEAVGVGAAEAAARDLAAAGGTPADLAALVTHYRSMPLAWGPGALVMRIRRWRPGQDPTEHWPPASEAYLAAEAQRRRAAATRADSERRTRLDRQRAASQVERKRLLAEWSALDPAEQERLLDAAQPDWRRQGYPRDSYFAAVVALETPRRRRAQSVSEGSGDA